MKIKVTKEGITVTCFGATKRHVMQDMHEARDFVLTNLDVDTAPKKKKKPAPKKAKVTVVASAAPVDPPAVGSSPADSNFQ
jgi:hypothetical protein